MVGRGWVRKARLSGDPRLLRERAGVRGHGGGRGAGKYPCALGLRTLVLMNDHKFAEARDLSQHILTLDPMDLVALGTLSDAQLELGRVDEAVGAAQTLVNTKPNMASSSRASYLRWLHGDTDGAKMLVQEALATCADPGTGRVDVRSGGHDFLAGRGL